MKQSKYFGFAPQAGLNINLNLCKRMKLMTYNILNGGQDNYNYDRLDKIISAIKSYNPDVLAVQEAMYFQQNKMKVFFRLENELNMRGFLAEANTGQHVALFVSKKAIVEECEIDTIHFHHAMIKIKVRLENERSMTIISTHLCPYGGENRLKEVLYLTNNSRTNDYAIVMGDLNSVSKEEGNVDAILDLPSHYQFRHFFPASKTKVDTRVIETLELSGMIDLHKYFKKKDVDHSAPTKNEMHGKEFSKMRVDYIFGTPLVAKALLSCETLKNEITDYASDHYPIVSELNINLK